MATSDLCEILERFPESKFLVLGDVILDRYWFGDAQRLSPEAPVPVVRKRRSALRGGGAANVAANLAALGGTVELIGVTGDDVAAAELKSLLESSGIGAGHLVIERGRPTTTKTRVVALHQQVVRIDDEDTTPIAPESVAQAVRSVHDVLGGVGGVVISDYAKGFLTPLLLSAVIEFANGMGKPVFVDPKGSDYTRYRGCTLIKPNRVELSLLTGMPVRSHEETLVAGQYLTSRLDGALLLTTESEDGMTLFSAGRAPEHAPCVPRQVYDVTGAGDTVLATLSMAVCAGASYRAAMDLAIQAAAIAVGVIGTSVVSRAELAGAVTEPSAAKAIPSHAR